jgi:hypothetical protein
VGEKGARERAAGSFILQQLHFHQPNRKSAAENEIIDPGHENVVDRHLG